MRFGHTGLTIGANSFNRGAFDISLIASIASHLTYWADEDVNHFILSQVLSRKALC